MNSILRKAWLPVLAIVGAFVLFGANSAISQVPTASADVTDTYYVTDSADCGIGATATDFDGETVDVHTGDSVMICAEFDAFDEANFQATAGKFVDEALCADATTAITVASSQDECTEYTGINTPDVLIQEGSFDDIDTGVTSVLVTFDCPAKAVIVTVDISQTDSDNVSTGTIRCLGEPDTVTVTVNPSKVEIIPAPGSVAHSEITIVASSNGLPIFMGSDLADSDREIDVSVPKCAIELGNNDPDTTPLSDSTADGNEGFSTTDFGDAAFVRETPPSKPTATTIDNIWFHADWNNCTPGDVIVTVSVEVDGAADIVRTATINVVGPAAFLTAAASPTSLICGEKSTITIKVTDSIGQNVSDNTQVELITNFGGVLGGTGATLGFPGTGPVNPLSSTAAATYNGVAVAYLLTSNNHVGSYEVVAAAGGTTGQSLGVNDPFFNNSDTAIVHVSHASVSSAPVTTQVTVNCALPAAPTVTAPNTGTGTGNITPPNTGDAGLAASSSNASLFVVLGAAAFALAGLASLKFARR